ncbi:MAG TPA: hypothetical protein VJJ02_04500 [Candidatus Paceibacterota bacterium]
MFGRTKHASVFDGKGKLGDEALGATWRKFRDGETRINAGSLDYHEFIAGVQNLLEGKAPGREKAWRPFWCTQLGTHKTAQALCEAVSVSGCSVEATAVDLLLDHTPLSPALLPICTGVLTPAYLGFAEEASYRSICERALARGYVLAPAELGPQFARQYRGQGDLIHIGMEVIREQIFKLERNDTYLELHTSFMTFEGREKMFDLYSLWVFMNPNKDSARFCLHPSGRYLNASLL